MKSYKPISVEESAYLKLRKIRRVLNYHSDSDFSYSDVIDKISDYYVDNVISKFEKNGGIEK